MESTWQLMLANAEVRSDGLSTVENHHHGTTNGYRLGCRCHRCREAKRRSSTAHVKPIRECTDCQSQFTYEYGKTGQLRCAACMELVRSERRQAEQKRTQRRTCAHCGVGYIYSSRSNHGTKYCGDCTVRDRLDSKRRLARTCPICDAKHNHTNRLGVCDGCYNMMPRFMWDAFNKHKVSIDIVLQFAETLACAICGTDLTVFALDHKRRLRPIHAVDHDHSCCPGGTSCGRCVRGILCRKCNVAIGYLNDDPALAKAVSDYLERTGGETS